MSTPDGHGIELDPVLAARLSALGPLLDIPADTGLTAAVLARIGETVPEAATTRWRRRLVAGLVALLATLGGLLAYEPARTAIAGWLGIGAVRIVQGPVPLPERSSATTPGAATSGSNLVDVGAAQAKVSFPIRMPDPSVSGAPRRIETDTTVPGGLVAITFDRFTLTEIASQPDQRPAMGKFVPDDVQYLSVNGRDGAWITGAAHAIGYIDPTGELRSETLRQAGNVLLWEADGITFRIEGLTGPTAKDDSFAIAATLR